MSARSWVLATDVRRLGGMVGALRALGGGVTVAVVGPQSVAKAAVGAGADAVVWFEPADDVPAEAYAPALAQAVSAAKPPAVLAAVTPPGRALLGAAAAALNAVVITGVLGVSLEGETVVVERTDLGGRVVETLESSPPVAGLYVGEDAPSPDRPGLAPIERLGIGSSAEIRIEKTEPVIGASGGVRDAERVVAVGRGLKAREDLALVEELAAALGAEIGCSMPIADDFRWVPKERYIGRSGQHISPRLYVAIGISGAPQHLEGVRDAKVVVAINTDPDAPVFHRADYGIVGDLYEVIPALEAALGNLNIQLTH